MLEANPEIATAAIWERLADTHAATIAYPTLRAYVTRRRPGKVNLLPIASPGPHSGLIIEVPEAEPVMRRHRERLDASAPLGIPAHFTVLFPFTPPEGQAP